MRIAHAPKPTLRKQKARIVHDELSLYASELVRGEHTFAVSPRATYLFEGFGAPLAIDLAALKLRGGQLLHLEMLGDFAYIGVPGEGLLGGFFSTTPDKSGLLPINSAHPINTTAFSPIDLQGDFSISSVLARGGVDLASNFNGIDVVIPRGAHDLIVALFDNNYGDNPVNDPDLAVRLTF